MRSAWPKLLIAIIAFVLLVSIGVGGFVWWKTAPPPAMNAMPVLIEARAAVQPPEGGEDAWPRYVAFFRDTLGMGTWDDTSATPESELFYSTPLLTMLSELQQGDWDDPRLEPAKRVLDRGAVFIEDALRIAEAPAMMAPYPLASSSAIDSSDAPDGTQIEDIESELPSNFNRLAWWLRVHARRQLEMGEHSAAGQTLSALFTISSQARMNPGISMLPIGQSIEVETLRIIRLHTLENDLDAATADRFLDLIDQMAPRDVVGITLHVVALLKVNQDVRFESAEQVRRMLEERDISLLFDAVPPRRYQREMRRYINAVAAVSDLPRAHRPTITPHQVAGDMGSYIYTLRAQNGIRSTRAATRIILLLERHHALNDEWPAALEDIMPREDTLDPNTLTPFVYERTPDGPFPFSLAAPPEADFLPPDQRLFTQPRRPIDEQSLSIEAAP